MYIFIFFSVPHVMYRYIIYILSEINELKLENAYNIHTCIINENNL